MALVVPPPTVRALFAGMGAAKVTLDSQYMKQGTYWNRIDKCKIDRSRKAVTFCAVEMTVVRVIDDNNGKAHHVGEAVSHLFMDGGNQKDFFLPNLKAFICNITGTPADAITDEEGLELMTFAFDDYNFDGQKGPGLQPFRNMVVEVNARLKRTKVDKDFTAINYLREVPAAEVIQFLPPADVARFFPGQLLEKKIAAESAA